MSARIALAPVLLATSFLLSACVMSEAPSDYEAALLPSENNYPELDLPDSSPPLPPGAPLPAPCSFVSPGLIPDLVPQARPVALTEIVPTRTGCGWETRPEAVDMPGVPRVFLVIERENRAGDTPDQIRAALARGCEPDGGYVPVDLGDTLVEEGAAEGEICGLERYSSDTAHGAIYLYARDGESTLTVSILAQPAHPDQLREGLVEVLHNALAAQ